MAGLYVHIPFCKSRCIYCSFFSTTGLTPLLQEQYVGALCKELSLRGDYLNGAPVNTLYIGGGTPSLLSPHSIGKIAENFHDLVEFTVECNPDDITPSFASGLVEMGVNRVSMGVQTFSDSRLSFLRRRHSASQIPQAIEHLRQAGIDNISIDLIFGFPDQTLQEWEDDISKALSLRVQHLSAYSLSYEQGTALYNMLSREDVREISDDESLAMYDTLIDRLTGAGYEHYEISNFALPGKRARHNAAYWDGTPYLGIGAGAHSYTHYPTPSRQWNVSNVAEYIDSIKRGIIPCDKEQLDEDTQYNDIITTALRTSTGICTDALDEPHRTYLLSQATKHIRRGTLCTETIDGRQFLHLTRKGLFISDDVMSDLIKI